ncbi:MAG TPA: DNA translocase FtsK 4TM domain-containing protein, partial [Chloroflexota bacterium]|nr:DNA translocase FtsK 4TM domain-containing protein [Chloroflexota bacterium]
MAQPIGRLLGRLFGWLAPGAAVWIGLVALLLISRRIHPRPWPWTRLGAGAVATFALLGIAALEAQRRGGPDDAPGGGLVGRWVADSLQAWFGTPSTVGVLILALVPSLFIAMRVSPVATATWIVAAVRLGLRGASALRSRIHRPEFTINRHESSQARRERPARAQHDDSAHAIPATDSLNATVPDAPGAQPRSSRWKTPPLTMFHARKSVERPAGELRQQAQIIEETLASFNIDARVVEANQGPVVTQFGVEPATGVPVSRITARVNDLALRLGSTSIRIEAPVPGRRMLGIEVPNSSVSLVTLREVMESTAAERSRARIPLALGKDIAGKSLVGDLARMPHLLIAGATGSGKSVCINTLIASMLSQFTPDELQLLMIDPKMVELIAYNGVPHLRMPVITEMDKVVGTLKWALKEMERRYKLFAACSARNIDSYNRGIQARAQ